MAASTYFAQVQQLYIAYFGRPADTVGLNFWANSIDAANGSIAAVQAGFSASAESQALFGNKSTIDKVTAIYQNAFGRAPEPAGLAFWVARLDSGAVTQAQASWTIQQSAGAGDAAVVQNKLTAAQAFTAQIDTTAEIQGYQGTAAADVARAFLAGVNTTAQTTAAVAGAASALANAVAVGGTGSSFVLTTGVDNLTGTSSNDTFTADNTGTNKVISAADTINGGAGVDTLKVFLAAGDSSFTNPTLNSVENVTINGGIVTAYTAAAGTTGLTIEAPVALGATYTVAGQAVTLKGSALAGTTTIASAADTAANVTLSSWTGSTVALTGAAVTTANLTTTGANSSITLTGTSALKTLNLAGDKNLTVATGVALTAVNASTATGSVLVDVSAATNVAAFAFTGGAGNDTLTLADGNIATLTAGTQLNGGAGTDTLAIKNTALSAAEYTKLNAVTGFEVLGLTAQNTAVDASLLTGFKSFAISNTGDTISNLGAGTTVNFVTGVTAATLGAALGNTSTEVVLGTAGVAGVTVAGLTTTGLTTLGLTSNGTSANAITALTNSDNSTITVKGATDLTIGSVAGTTTGSKVDASAFTGKLTVTGSGVADIIIGGTGADTINGGSGADTLTGGAGIDTFSFTATTGATASGVTFGQADVITDFVVGTDKLQFAGVTDVVSGQQAAVQTAVTNLAAGATNAQIATAMATASTTNLGVSFATYGGNTYVLYETAGAGTGVAADDVFIQLTGVTTAPTFANSVVA